MNINVIQLLYYAFMVIIGSYGAFILFGDIIELERFFSIRSILIVLRKHWYAVLALIVAFAMFFISLYFNTRG